jgi:hypothetical protein
MMRRSTSFELWFREAGAFASTLRAVYIALYRAFGLQLRSRREK